MKFTEGMWRIREGIRIDWMNNVERLRIENETVDLLLNKFQRHRGDTLNSATISAQVTSPLEGIVGVKLVHWAGGIGKGPHYELAHSTGHVQIQHHDNKALHYTSGGLNLAVTTAPNELDFVFSTPAPTSKKLTGHSWRSIGYIGDQTTDKSRWDDGIFFERQGYMLAALDLGVGEKLYGLGERFGPFVKNGQTVDIWNEDGGTSSELAYKNIPFYLSSNGYGVFVNHPGKVSLELQSERTTRVNISVPGEELEYFVIYGGTPKEILERYTALTGRPSLVPAWSYNLWLTTSFTTNYDEQTVTGFLDGFRDRDIPLGVFHFDCFWMKSYQWCDFEFDSAMFPDAAGYIKRLKERGLRISVWLNPYVGQASPLFQEGKEKGYFIKRTDGTVWQWDYWQAGMAIVDFTNPAACEWFAHHLRRLLALGVDSFKTDFGERIPYRHVRYFDASVDPARMHNYYTLLFNQLCYTTLAAHHPEAATNPDSNAVLFARSTAAGGQRFPIHWGGDCESTYEAMAESLRGCLSLGLSGFIFWASDIGGFEGTPPPDVYKRWVQFGLLSTHSRLHGSHSFRVPWIYGEDCSQVLRACVKRKIALTPYLLAMALHGHRRGTPVMRPLLLEFPRDRTVWTVDTQFMLGDALLVAPVFSESGVVEFYVPRTDADADADADASPSGDARAGKWVSWFDHTKTYEEGRWYTETHGFDTLPLLIRPGAVVPVNFKLQRPEDDPLDGLEVLVNGAIPTEGVEVEVVDPVRTHEVLRVVKLAAEGGEVRADVEGVRVQVVR
ncbi:putative sugar hydrolase [Aspergillus saccharolyticus JOP 1030-1]|uniref:alpha-D-xyloside xylohydrolase n=1 Tax=Aspergillus saccharolyticus JOP 1030-1 TaxID=1450539 RepID=A0A319AC63_9EURO|nr:alpha-glucosidase [Aspergillus saccharolyticus JOP 1030-1]PYH49248.1 alpha-glucosidase [Aspergillus saccharolyticus JOP 1030-1]